MTVQLQPYWIGYRSLDAWRAAIDPAQPVYLGLDSERGKPDGRGLWIERLVLLAAQPAGDLMHYCRMPAASMRWQNDQPFDADPASQRAKANDALLETRKRLEDRGLQVVDGLVAAPLNARLLDSSYWF